MTERHNMLRKSIPFGFLPEKISVEVNGLSISPLADFDKRIKLASDECRQSNGFIFSPTHHVIQANKKVSFVPNLFKFFPTHTLTMHSRKSDIYNYAINPTFFLLQVLGWATGYRLLPAEAWFDLRVPIKPQINILITAPDIEHVMMTAMKAWGRWKPSRRIAMTNLIFVFNRNPSYCWEFEKFEFEYRIIDTCANLRGVRGRHSERMRGLLKDLKIENALDVGVERKISRLRNNLVHELRWGQTLIAGPANGDVFYITGLLRRINHRILGRMLGLEGEYFSTNAKSIGRYKFGPFGDPDR